MPYKPSFTVSPVLVKAIEEMAVGRDRLVTAAVRVPWVPILQKEAREKNTHGSTSIEGNTLSLEEVRMLDEGKDLLSAAEKEKREVRNYLDALRRIEKAGARGGRIGHHEVLDLHGVVMAGIIQAELAGRYRPHGVRVGSHVPPPPGKVHDLMTELLAWVNGPAGDLAPVISSAILHFRFEDIHPFADGNGRTGRLLALWELYRRGFDTLHVFSVDEYYWHNRQAYYRALQEVRTNGGDLTHWIEFVAEAVLATMRQVLKRTAVLTGKSGREPVVLRPKQERLLELLRDTQGMSPSQIWDALKVSRQGAMDLLNPLMKAGMVKRVGGKKYGKYILS